jgi:ParB family chromosome partitioning protein
MAKQTFKAKRTSAFNFDPDDLIIIGIDTDDDETHHLYDERIKRKGYVSEAMIKNVQSMGVIETISVTKVGNQAVVVDGRRRVLAARKANKRLKKRGEEPLLVPALIKKGDEEGLMGVLISGNEHRLDDDPITRAEKAQRLKDRGRNNVQIGLYFGVSGTSVGNWLKVLDCVSVVKNAVRSGDISMSAALELADLDPEEQKEALEKMLDSGNKSVDDAKGHAGGNGAGGGGRSASRAPKRALVRKIVEHEQASKVLGDDFLRGLLWSIGEMESEHVKGLSDLIDELG